MPWIILATDEKAPLDPETRVISGLDPSGFRSHSKIAWATPFADRAAAKQTIDRLKKDFPNFRFKAVKP